MVDPISNAHKVSEIGAAESLSQVAASSAANDREDAKDASPHFQKLRQYITQMQGMVLDTEA